MYPNGSAEQLAQAYHKRIADNKREIKRQIRLAYELGRTVPYSLSTLIDSGVSVNVIRKVYRTKEVTPNAN